EADGRPTIVQSAHLSPAALVLSAFRIGRFVPGRLHRRSIGAGRADVTTAAETWTSGACVSISTALLRDVGGFDDSYFLYFEDADLGRRIGRVHPHVRMRTAAVPPGVHGVGGSA